jgi:hypothetical protein
MLTLQEISDRLEIQKLLVDYATAIDQKQIDRLSDIFLPDAFVSYAPYGGREGPFNEIKDWLAEALAGYPASQHLVANPDITIEGDTAKGRVMCFNPLVTADAEGKRGLTFLGLWYVDTYVRTAQGWRIASRSEEPCWIHSGEEGTPLAGA